MNKEKKYRFDVSAMDPAKPSTVIIHGWDSVNNKKITETIELRGIVPVYSINHFTSLGGGNGNSRRNNKKN